MIAFYFQAQCRFERSTFGGALAAAQTHATGSDGRRIRGRRRSWHWQPDAFEGHDALTLRARQGAPAPPVTLRGDRGDGEGYEVEDDVLVRFARASRRMLAVERRSLAAKRALEAYYGDRGCMWAAATCDRRGEGGQVVWRGAGPGSIAALYVLTEGGQRFIVAERARAAKRAGMAECAMPHLTDDEVLAAAFTLQQVQPDPLRAARLNRVRDEAERLLLEAMRVWQGTAPAAGGQPPRAQRAA
jgi:hypothetical protein